MDEHAEPNAGGAARLLAVAAHDMRQPLHALLLYVGALERRVDSAEARDILVKMDRAARSMDAMFANLLEFARLQSGETAVELVECPAQDVLDRVVAAYPACTAQATPLKLRTDPALLERALRQLAANAVTHGGGARIEVAAHGAEIEIAVTDDGPGVAAADQGRIFEPFVRLGEHRGDGLGLGLAIATRIMAVLGGSIALHSAPGSGARFSIRLARAP